MGNRSKCCDEFQTKHLVFALRREEDRRMFSSSYSSCCTPVAILVFRLVAFIHLCIGLFISIRQRNSIIWTFYLTSLNYVFVTIHFFLSVCLSAHTVRKMNQRRTKQTGSLDSNVRLTSVKSSATDEIDLEQADDDVFLTSSSSSANGTTTTRVLATRQISNQSSTNYDEQFVCGYRAYWAFYNICLSFSFLIMIIYWLFMYNPANNVNDTPLHVWLRVDRHLIVYIFLLIDFLSTRTPIRLLHFYFPSIMLTVYFLVNFLIWKMTGLALYRMIDYNESVTRAGVVILVGVTVGVPLVQCVNYILYRMKKCCCGVREL